ncbi:hypothetical protein SNEBB_009711 [Seison nebaliae]|nr:hypothetical protein SNEBB_009711 [Seison nebaliae]
MKIFIFFLFISIRLIRSAEKDEVTEVLSDDFSGYKVDLTSGSSIFAQSDFDPEDVDMSPILPTEGDVLDDASYDIGDQVKQESNMERSSFFSSLDGTPDEMTVQLKIGLNDKTVMDVEAIDRGYRDGPKLLIDHEAKNGLLEKKIYEQYYHLYELVSQKGFVVHDIVRYRGKKKKTTFMTIHLPGETVSVVPVQFLTDNSNSDESEEETKEASRYAVMRSSMTMPSVFKRKKEAKRKRKMKRRRNRRKNRKGKNRHNRPKRSTEDIEAENEEDKIELPIGGFWSKWIKDKGCNLQCGKNTKFFKWRYVKTIMPSPDDVLITDRPVVNSATIFHNVQKLKLQTSPFIIQMKSVKCKVRRKCRKPIRSHQNRRKCRLTPNVGIKKICHENLVRYFYDYKSNKCKKFKYSGCGGNGNRYASKKECRSRCRT